MIRILLYKILMSLPTIFLLLIIGWIYIDVNADPTVGSITGGAYNIEIFDDYRYSLWNREKNEAVVSDIQKYRIIESLKKIYLIGEDEPIDNEYKYFICDYDKVECNSYQTLDDVSEQDKKIFEDKDKFQISPFFDINEELVIGRLYIIKTFRYNRYALWNHEKNEAVVSDIQKYKIIESLKKIYLIGEDESSADNSFKHFICDYKNMKCKVYETLDEMKEKDREIFKIDDGFQIPNEDS